MDLSGKFVIDPAGVGWLGTARQLRISIDGRFRKAVAQRAAELGIDIGDLATIETGTPDVFVVIETGTPEKWLAADKLCAYIEGLQDALTGSYGNPPVEVGRKDLGLVLAAFRRAWPADVAATDAATRLQQVLDEPPQRA